MAHRPTVRSTLAAYDLALKEGADGVECDVRLTRDGHLVCVHDRRWTGHGTGLVSEMTLAQLRELDYGAWHPSWRPDGSHGDTGLLALDDLVSLVLDWNRPVKLSSRPSIPSATARLWKARCWPCCTGGIVAGIGGSVPRGRDVVFGGRGVADPTGGPDASDGAAR